MSQKPWTQIRKMYRSSSPGQLSFADFYLPFGGKLSSKNRWVKLSQLIPWESIETAYAEQFCEGMGAPGKSARLALGALIIQERLGLSDRETVEQIRENPYLQYFLGLSEYSDNAPFEASSLVHFRKRLNPNLLSHVNELIIEQAQQNQEREASASDEHDSDDDPPEPPTHQGKLVLDATCAPADIRYPTDLNLLHQAREKSDEIIDQLYHPIKARYKRKLRTYRTKARQAYLQVAKQKRPRRKVMRKAVGKQLRYLRRNLMHIDQLLADGACLTWLSHRQYRLLLVIQEVFRQQLRMYETQTHRIEHRLVSLSQPHIRPIVRGKAGTSVEFGAKLAVSYVGGYLRLERLDWDNFNESGELMAQVEAYHQRMGSYPESVHADQVYRTKDNRDWCRARGIRLTGPALGKSKATSVAANKKQIKADASYRNRIEGKFGQGKRRFGLGLVMTKLAQTSETAISMTILVMNLEQLLWQLIFVLLSLRRFFYRPVRVDSGPLQTNVTLQECQKKGLNELLLLTTHMKRAAC